MKLYSNLMHDWERRLTLRDRNRRIFPFDWGTEWLESDGRPVLHPLEQLKRLACGALEESERFFRPPNRPAIKITEDRISFPSPLKGPLASNNTAYARLFPGGGRKAAVVIPQWNAGAGSHVTLCRLLQRMGVTAVRLTLPFHEERRPPGMIRADYMVSPNVGRTLHATRQAVLEVRQLVDWLRRGGHTEIAIVGTSIGSCVGYLSFVHERGIDCGVFTHVSSFFADVVWSGLSTRYVRWGLETHVGLEDLRACWAPISPWHHIPRLHGDNRPHLLMSARYDLTFPAGLSGKVFDRYREFHIPCRHIELPCGHYSTGRFPFSWLVGFQICRFLSAAFHKYDDVC